MDRTPAAGWITLRSPMSGVGSTIIRYDVATNPTINANSFRAAPLMVRWDTPTAGQNVWIRQMPSCSILPIDLRDDDFHLIGLLTATAPASGGPSSFETLVDLPFSCPWSARSLDDWITVTFPAFPAFQRGDSGVHFVLEPNTTGVQRIGQIQLAEKILTIIQSAQ